VAPDAAELQEPQTIAETPSVLRKIYPIVKYGDPILEKSTAAVKKFDADFLQLTEDMFASMYAAQGVGLAAPQIGLSLRVAVVDVTGGKNPEGRVVLANPEVIHFEGEKREEEGCLSIPGLHGKVPRYLDINIRYQTLEGKTESHDAYSSWAALLQHECDHLDGIVYPMRMTDLSLLAFNEEPGPLARDVAESPKGIDPLFIDLVERWPGRARWFGA